MTDVQTRPELDEPGERVRLSAVLTRLDAEALRLADVIDRSAADIDTSKRFIWANQRDMDHAEKANMRSEVGVAVTVAGGAVAARKRVERLRDSPYFGRVDFSADGEGSDGEGSDADGDSAKYYIGLHGFRDKDSLEILIYDWRAPVSSLYYDYERGEASYSAPEGAKSGEITGKRQYKISGGELEYMLESSLNIGDAVLQRELSESTDDKMKNIVATIQREQNAVIRNETAEVLILQGVAGSGKTSIALHRVAFLLYRFADTLSSDNVMILSPNRVFGDYISSVLPELGEQQVKETDFDALAKRFLAKITDYETFSEQVSALLVGVDEDSSRRMRYKASPEFVTELGDWIAVRAEQDFAPTDIRQRGVTIDAEWVADRFATLQALPLFTRLERLADAAAHHVKAQLSLTTTTGPRWTARDASGVRAQVQAMFPFKDAVTLYRAFYDAPERQGLFRQAGKRRIEYSDAFPLVYTLLATRRHDGTKVYESVRHLLVDEMQDYTPIQYAVVRQLFTCRMTILGDANQQVNPFSSSSIDTIGRVFPEADLLELNKSYRSTTEITAFAQSISRNDRLVPVDRHGPAPSVVPCADDAGEAGHIASLTAALLERGHRSIGIITKTVDQARTLHDALTGADVDLTLLDYGSETFATGVLVTSAHISKGLEFDAVIVPGVDAGAYATPMDKGMLYIACTRAMHELHLSHVGEPTGFLAFATEGAR